MISYPTLTDICVVTNNPEATYQVLSQWDLRVELCGDTARYSGDLSPYWLLWRHRSVIKQAHVTGVLKLIYSGFIAKRFFTV